MMKARALSERIKAGFTEPESIEKLITLHTAEGQNVTLSSRETERLYYWLYEYRHTFINLYGQGWNLAETYWTEAGRPDSYPSKLDLFNAPAAEIPVAPYTDGLTPSDSPTDAALNGFFACIRHMEEEAEQAATEQETQE